jgi:hypothetical protein
MIRLLAYAYHLPPSPSPPPPPSASCFSVFLCVTGIVLTDGRGQCCGSGMLIPDPSGMVIQIFPFRIHGQKDFGSGFASKNIHMVSSFTPKTISKISEKLYGMFIPDPGAGFFFHPGSQIQGSKQHQFPDPGSGSAALGGVVEGTGEEPNHTTARKPCHYKSFNTL